MEISKTSEHDDVKAGSERPFAEALAAMKKSLRFWIGMTVWIAPPLLALIVWTIS
jgi:hypothetical protein